MACCTLVRLYTDSVASIVAVPGLGAHPIDSWTWSPPRNPDGSGGSKNGQEFNWIKDEKGLAALHPNSRIMLYDFASAWIGKRKVPATLRNICTVLLESLVEKRKVHCPCAMLATDPGDVLTVFRADWKSLVLWSSLDIAWGAS